MSKKVNVKVNTKTAEINNEFIEAEKEKKEYKVKFLKSYIGKFGTFYAGKIYSLDKEVFKIFKNSNTVEEIK